MNPFLVYFLIPSLGLTSIFLVMKKLQLNPEVSGIVFRTPLTQEMEMSLYRYFKAVEVI